MTVGSLFSGIGGIDLGFEQAGFRVLWAIEKDPNCCNTYAANFPDHILIHEDIRKVQAEQLPVVDVLCAGFPCQPFSIGGNQHGFADRRGNLFFEVARFIHVLKPRFIFLENVANLVQHDNGRTFQTIYTSLIEEGYYVRYQVLRASEYGNVPQIRDRIYIIAFRHLEDCDRFEFPAPIELQSTIFSILKRSTPAQESYYYTDNSPFALLARQIVNDPRSIYRVYHNSIKPIRNSMCPTLTASMGTQSNQVPLVCDPFGVRKLTLRECLSFQGFPESFGFPRGISIDAAYKQIGNSVCVPVIRRIAEKLLELNR